MSVDPKLAINYANRSSKHQKEVYGLWAENYDHDLINDFGYVAHEEAVMALQRHKPATTTPIVDVGCRTGLVGKVLTSKGYQTIDGLDLSSEMFAKAFSLGIYRHLPQWDLAEKFKLPAIYGVILCLGVFSHNPAHAFQLAKLFQGLLPSGLLIVTVNGKGWEEINWLDLLNKSSHKHDLSVETITDIPYLVKQKIEGKLLVLKDNVGNRGL